MRRVSEYDAFGPWIQQVTSSEDLPRLFRGAGIIPEAQRLVLKLPRLIERRNATPDTHLYDHLIAVGAANLTILSRHDDRYHTVDVPLDRIAALVDTTNLLDGHLGVFTVDGAVALVPYNAADPKPMATLIELVRGLYLPSSVPADSFPVPGAPALDVEDTGLLTAYANTVAAEPGMRLVCDIARRVVQRHVRRTTLHASLWLADHRETQVLHRREWFSYGNDKVLSMGRTVLPHARINQVRTFAHERFRDVNVIAVDAGNASLAFPVPAGPATTTLLGHLNAVR
ncbi:hypothetical protein [Actinoplanes sp. TFC3]|uniref:hypothetical protein n=1 Tax=Actinoplanes sp. TFC3 TaxID=1710355 RepID=UPI00083338CE|nr:hypothetical protein [Actinoplanes sp. TFC3]